MTQSLCILLYKNVFIIVYTQGIACQQFSKVDRSTSYKVEDVKHEAEIYF